MFHKIIKFFSTYPKDNRTEEEKEFLEITKQIKNRLHCLKEYGNGSIRVKINDLFNSYSKPPYDGYYAYFETFNNKRAILEIISLIYPVYDDVRERQKKEINDIIKSSKSYHLGVLREDMEEVENERKKDWVDFIKLMSETPIMSFSSFRYIHRGDTESTARHLLTLEDLKIKEKYPVNIDRFIEIVDNGEHIKF